jgi:hypothetical protein
MNEFSAGSVLSRSFSIFFKNFIPFMILQILVYSPLLVYTAILVSGELTIDSIVIWGVVVGIGGLLLNMVATGAMTYGVFQQLRGRSAGLGQCLLVGVKRMLPVLGVGILAAICIGLGFVALLIPGIILLCMLWVAVPVAVVERPGVFGSLSRSAELTKDNRLRIFGVVVVLFAINKLAEYLLESGVIGDAPSVGDIKLYLLLVLVTSLALGALSAVAAAVGYHDLRASKEGVGVEELARVFE